MFYPCGSYFLTATIRDHWTELNHTLTHIHLRLLFELPQAFTHPRAVGHKTLWGLTLNFDRTYLYNGTWYQQSKRNLSIYRYSPICRQIWWTLVWKRRRTVGEFLPTSLNFCIVRLPTLLMDWRLYNRAGTRWHVLCSYLVFSFLIQELIPIVLYYLQYSSSSKVWYDLTCWKHC